MDLRALVGAGTVTTPAQAEESAAAGAQFLVSPGTLPDGRRFVVGMGVDLTDRTSADRAQRSATGRRAGVRNDRHDWAVSTDIAHTPLVSEHDFLSARTVDTEHRDTENGKHVYALSGRLRCGLCGRRLDSHRVHDRPDYRCRHGHTSARTRPENAPRNLYLREDPCSPTSDVTSPPRASPPTPGATYRWTTR